MSPSDDPSGWNPESEQSSASGGRLPADAGTYDVVAAPPGSSNRTEVIRRPGGEGPTDRPRKRVGIRRVRRTLRKVDPLSVLKLSLFFYTIFLIVWLLFVAVVYSVLESMGLFNMIEDLADAFAVNWDSNITLMTVERWAFLIGLTLVVLGAIVNVFLSFIYNVASDLIGGIEMTFAEKDG